MSSAFDFAASVTTPSRARQDVELPGNQNKKKTWGSGYRQDDNDLEAALLSHESANVSSEERNLLSQISNAKIITDEDLMQEEMRARDSMMENVAQDVHKVHEIFSDLRDIVGEQAEAVDQVEQDVERAHSRAESGVNQLVGAAKRQKTGIGCLVKGLGCLAFIAGLLALALTIGPKLAGVR
eukprot:FR742177.1.p1 GENE.FR742177.1~~FR742177.1.p1  ORF type:complete len:182 (+),score=16.40 FR742177.1:111-656(+)